MGELAISPEQTMNVELCPKCRSWRVTETTLGEQTRCVCQECSFTWSVSAEGKFEALPQRSTREDVSN